MMKSDSIQTHVLCTRVKYICASVLFFLLCLDGVLTFNVDTKNVKVFQGPAGIYFGYSLAMLRNVQGNWLLVGAPRANDPLQPGITSPGVLLRCPLDGDSVRCDEVVVDTSGNVRVAGTFYGVTKVFDHDKNNQWLGVSVDVSPNNDRVAVCAHRWKDSKFVLPNDLLYMQGLCYELDAGFQLPARLLPVLVDYNSLVHRQERYPIWAYGALGQSVEYTKNGDALLMGAPGLNDWQGGFVIEDNMRRNFTVQPLSDDRRNWLIGYTVTSARLIRTNANYIIAGAPRANLNGSVFVFEYKSDQILNEPLIGDQLGSYFGSVLCAADVNNDQLDDVIVGAPFYSTNNTEEGRVYVYINRGMLKLELQEDRINGSTLNQARFGSAIANIGDINKDGYNDIAIGAPYEADGVGAVYIYNGYSGGLWPRYTQRILGTTISPGIKSFGAALTPRSVDEGEVFAVGAYETDNVAILRVNPVVSMETIMYVRPTIITASMPYLDLSTCFKYTGNAANLQSTLDITYTMLADTTTPAGSVRAIFEPNKVPYITRDLQITKDEFVCDNNVRIYAPYQDIWRDVDVEVRYGLDPATARQCVRNCPILERFNGKDPERSAQDVFRKVIQYDKQCGEDNKCDTGLQLKVLPLTESGYIVTGRDQSVDVKVGLLNNGENAYNIIMDVVMLGNFSSTIRTKDTFGETIVDCALLQYDNSDPALEVATHRCRVRKPYPLTTMEEVTFTLEIPLDSKAKMAEFEANFTVRTEEQDNHQASQALKLPVKSEYGLRIEGISGPEQVTLSVQQTSEEFTPVEHRYSIKNFGPSPLENAEIHAFVPAIIHRKDPLVTNISVWLTTYETNQPSKQRCYEDNGGGNIPNTESSGGYAISVDCSSFPCRRFSCNLLSFKKDESILVSVNVSVSRQILSRLQAKDTVRLASRISIPDVNFGKSLDKEVETMFHKTTNAMERKRVSIPIWLIIVSVVSAFLVLLVIVAILIKVGFFKRSKKEEMKRLMRRNSSPFSDTNTSNDTSARVNGTSDSSRIMSSIEDNDLSRADEAHINPATDPDNIDQLDGMPSKEKHSNFLNELQSASNRPFYKTDSSLDSGYKS
ncbi:integrin alpha-2-like [Ruditapes philippinarum]|uniref:integrin alpha-2-like n=1 Tax=Ruditapes philippinarum TaxID=129788 RepID=UPI00295B34D0|nr:integrin alpha-2-like [Ruditapes philippinarum]